MTFARKSRTHPRPPRSSVRENWKKKEKLSNFNIIEIGLGNHRNNSYQLKSNCLSKHWFNFVIFHKSNIIWQRERIQKKRNKQQISMKSKFFLPYFNSLFHTKNRSKNNCSEFYKNYVKTLFWFDADKKLSVRYLKTEEVLQAVFFFW